VTDVRRRRPGTKLCTTVFKIPLGLPAGIQKEYEAALKVRGISANAYGVLMGGFLNWL